MKIQFQVKNLEADQVKVEAVNVAIEYSVEEMKVAMENYPQIVAAIAELSFKSAVTVRSIKLCSSMTNK